MASWMLDTNAASAVIRGRSPDLDRRLAGTTICISVVTEAELRFGLARRPASAALARAVESFLAYVRILPWTSDCALVYAAMRTQLEARGKPLGAMDLMIAAHALEAKCTLVTADQAFSQVPGLNLEIWTTP